MNFKSGLVNFGSAEFRRAIVISLVLHVMLLWQRWPTATGKSSQAWPSQQALVLHASLPNPIQAPALAATSPPDLVGKQKTIPQQKKTIPALRQSQSPHPVPEVAAPDGAGLDANGLRQYRLGLAAAARGFKHYPPQALENGWSGTAEVSFIVAANGVVQPVQLLRSSGHDLLDAAAIEMVGRAAQRTALPGSLRGQSFSVPLPVVFDHTGK